MSKLKNWVSHGIAIGIIGFVVLLVVSFFLLIDFAWMRVAGFTYSTVKAAVFFSIFYELLFLLVEIVAEGLKKALMDLLHLSELWGKIFLYGCYLYSTFYITVFLNGVMDSLSAGAGSI